MTTRLYTYGKAFRLCLFTLSLLIAVLLVPRLAYAVPACSGAVNEAQPDGSPVKLFVRGDEMFHAVTDEAENMLLWDDSGTWVYIITRNGQLAFGGRADGKAPANAVLYSSISGDALARLRYANFAAYGTEAPVTVPEVTFFAGGIEAAPEGLNGSVTKTGVPVVRRMGGHILWQRSLA